MKVFIKDLGCQLDVKNVGVEFDVSDTDNTHKGDLYVTSTKLIWCRGRTRKENGKTITWKKFIEMMEQG